MNARWVIQLCVQLQSPVCLLFIKESLESVSEWHEFTLPCFQLTLQHSSHSEMLLSASKQRAGNWFQGITVKFCCFSRRLGGYTRTSGWPAEPAHHPSWWEHHSLPSASVSNPSVSLRDYAGFKYKILDYNVSYFQNTLGVVSFRITFLYVHTISSSYHRGLVFTVSTLMIMLLCLPLCETPSASPLSAPPVLCLLGQAWRIKEQETKAR